MHIKKQRTHELASEKLIGSVVSIGADSATVKLTITEQMTVDSYRLSHGSFVFGLADYAAMLAVNEPTVVLGKATSKFLKPVVLHDEVTAVAKITDNSEGKKLTVSVSVENQKNEKVFEGEFVCLVLEKHILAK